VIDEQLRRELGRELCGMIDGWIQAEAAELLHLNQPKISALRRGDYAGFSIGRLIRLIASRGYNIEVHLKPIHRRFAQPRKLPTLTVVRYDTYGVRVGANER
jgi:predicted XRE-type DNA-binding protein